MAKTLFRGRLTIELPTWRGCLPGTWREAHFLAWGCAIGAGAALALMWGVWTFVIAPVQPVGLEIRSHPEQTGHEREPRGVTL